MARQCDSMGNIGVPTFGSAATLLTPKQKPLLDLWQARRAERRLPARRMLDVVDLRPWLSDLHLLEVVAGGKDFRYRVYATNVSEFLGREMTGKMMSETPEVTLAAIGRSCYREVCEAAIPYLMRRPTMIYGSRVSHPAIREYLTLPLGDDGITVDRLLVLIGPPSRERKTADFVEFIPLDGETAPYQRTIEDLVLRAQT
jgi:hypothetical protein